MATIPRRGPNVFFSWFRYLTTEAYTVGSTTGVLTVHHSGLKIRAGYPDDITKIDTPTLAVCGPEEMAPGQAFFGPTEDEDLMPIYMYGFVVGQGNDANNRVYRDRFSSDVYQLVNLASDKGLILYDAVTKTAIGGLEVVEFKERLIPVNAFEVEAERYKFVVEAMISYA